MRKQTDWTKRQHRLLASFCQAADVPVYPITPILATLCELAKEDARTAPRGELFRALKVFVGIGEKLFRDERNYVELWELSDELVDMEDTDSSVGVSDTIDQKEDGAVPASERQEAEHENEDDHSDARHASVIQEVISEPPSSYSMAACASAKPCHSSSNYQAPLAGVGAALSPKQQRLADLLASPTFSCSSSEGYAHVCASRSSVMRACHGMDTSLLPTMRQKPLAHWLRLRAMAYPLVGMPKRRSTARCTIPFATRRRAKPSVAVSLSVSTANPTGPGSPMQHDQHTSTTTNRILAG